MAKHISTCTNPQLVHNKFTNKLVSVACGRCDGCQNRRAFRWSKRLEQEMLCHPYCFFVTLKYDDAHIPCYKIADSESSEIVSNREDLHVGRCLPISFADLYSHLGHSGKEIEYVQNRLSHPIGLPHGSVGDLQKFFKRLNRYINYHITHVYKNFLYWFVCEYGPTTFRPHYHGLLFIDSKEVADKIEKILSETWSLGSRDVSAVKYEGAASNYVAQYLNCFAHLPKVYTKFRQLSPFFLCSRKTIIGSDYPLVSDLQKVFLDASPRRSSPNFRTHRYMDVPLLPSVENRLFPRIARYCSISDTDRITLYGLYASAGVTNYSDFETWCKYQISRVFPKNWQKNIIYEYIMCLTYGGNFALPKSRSALYRFYCISRRVAFNAASFGISVRSYACNILRYYERKDMYNLSEFYRFQSDYVQFHPLPDLIHMYPDFYHQYDNGGDIPYLEYVMDSFCCDFFPSFDNTFDIKSQVIIQRRIRSDNTKTHEKNSYFEKKLKYNDYQLYKLIKDYKS